MLIEKKLFTNINLINLLIALIPLTLIIGNSAVNLNVVLICLTGIIAYKFELFKINDIENCDGKCIHYYTNDKNKVVLSLLEDIYIILHSDYFIPSNKSGVSKWIIQMLNEKKNIFKLTNLKCKLL